MKKKLLVVLSLFGLSMSIAEAFSVAGVIGSAIDVVSGKGLSSDYDGDGQNNDNEVNVINGSDGWKIYEYKSNLPNDIPECSKG